MALVQLLGVAQDPFDLVHIITIFDYLGKLTHRAALLLQAPASHRVESFHGLSGTAQAESILRFDLS